jgi:hypothetical protein
MVQASKIDHPEAGCMCKCIGAAHRIELVEQ